MYYLRHLGKIIILIFNKNEGEYLRVIQNNEYKVISILAIHDILLNLENNQLIEMYFCEKVKFYYEKKIKEKLIKLQNEKIETENEVKTPMPSQ